MTLLGRTGTSRSELRPSELAFERCQGLERPHLWFSLDLPDLHDLLRLEQLVQVLALAF